MSFINHNRGGVFLFLAVVSCTVSAAPSCDEIIAKHIQAHGGLDAWNAVATLKIEGTYTGFSEPAPFTLIRKRPNAFFFDHVLGKRPVTIGFDGQQAWWINTWYGVDWPIKIAGPDLNTILQERDFATPFFDYREAGYRVELVGQDEFEGQQVFQLKLTRPSGSEETWFLDAKTYLEKARKSMGSDFGREVPQTTFFSDFRTVEGLVIPFRIESEFDIRYRVMEIAKIEVNPKIDDAIFHMPLPKGMQPLQGMLGDWEVELHGRRSPQAPLQVVAKTTAHIAPLAAGGLFQETMTYVQGIPIESIRTWSFDRYKNLYRMTQYNDFHKVMQIFQGTFEEGALVVDNLTTDTAFEERGVLHHDRLTFTDLGSDTWTMTRERSADQGQTWEMDFKAVYTRPQPQEK